MRYIGFDMGDGESAVAVFQQNSGIEPVVQSIGGNKSILSAVGRVQGRIVVGEQAYTDSLAEGLSVRFKSRFTYDATSYDTVVLFARGVLEALRETGLPEDGDAFVVGCPAGWNAAAKARYRDLLIRAGIRSPQIVSESRAAFLYAKYAKTVALDIDILRESALVIDIGSSTLDFAYIVDGRETEVGTFGETNLGGGLLDEELLRRAIQKSRASAALEAVFAESKSWYSYAEIEARRVKEEYFARGDGVPGTVIKKRLRIRYDGVQTLDLALDAIEATSLVDSPLPRLNGLSFSEALQRALENAKQITALSPPKLVLLTGGASRMRFFQEQCRDTFAKAVVVSCPEPEFSIAKGLAYAGWIDENMREFRKCVAAEITDERVAAIAREALPGLKPGVANALAELALEEAAIPVAAQWKAGHIETLAEMNRQMQSRVERVMQSNLAVEALAPVIEVWIKDVSVSLQALIDPLCDRYQVPRREMRLSFDQMGEAGRLTVGAKELLGLPVIGAVAGVALGVLGGTLCGGGGIALVAAGPIGFLAGAAMGAVVAAIGWPALSEAVMKAKIPAPLRWMNMEKRLRSGMVKKNLRDAISKEIGGEGSAFSQKVVEGFTGSFQKHLRQMVQAAEIPIQ